MIIFIFLLFIICEFIFRTILPASMFPMREVNTDYNIYYSVPFSTQGLETNGWLPRNESVYWRINNVGWHSGYDYNEEKKEGIKRIAIIGDSNVKAQQVDFRDHFENSIIENIDQSVEVYRFCANGWGLSQYLHIANYAKDVYNPDVFVFLIIIRDILECTTSYYESQKYEQLLVKTERDDEYSFIAPKLIPRSFSYKINQLLWHSATYRYLRNNKGILLSAAHLKNLINSAILHEHKKPEEAVEGPSSMDEKEADNYDYFDLRMDVSEMVVDSLKNTLADKEIVFVFKPVNYRIYEDTQGRLPATHEILKLKAEEKNIQVLNLTDIFKQEWKNTGKYFDWTPKDNHWNEYGHKIAGTSIGKYLVEKGIVDNDISEVQEKSE